ncbi:ABC transporter ATP-binding protein [Aliiglaciecola sp. CAU 1673]|uniref:ABC transporter ATP-binding protein n=1 Tax=Aliiglaciecola sp. CAU 1673 TaxID=3032595 RepID=UPI0023DC6773|nr:ABC transporter ATP-binding protein [Aliiglaciecola sp. CAU 1673]MDF2177077.1 ABC transporter ATP-binding protein [Aliiglaciecola sp. CAU 1673]
MQQQPVISMQGVTFGWEKSPILDIPDWTVSKGQRVFLYGPSGSGKSTLLNLLSGILSPWQGQICILEQDLSRMKAGARDRFRARHLGMVFQQFNLLPYLSVRDNIALAHYFSPESNDDPSWLRHILERLGLTEELLARKASDLSVGQQQRVALARALLNRPELIIADEPTSALDTELRDQFMQLLLSCVKETQSTVIFVSHDRSLAEYFDIHQDLRALGKAQEAQPC